MVGSYAILALAVVLLLADKLVLRKDTRRRRLRPTQNRSPSCWWEQGVRERDCARPGFSQAYFAAADRYDHILLTDDRTQAERLDAQRQALHYYGLAATNSHDEQQRLLTLADRQLVSDDWHGLAARIEAALRAPGCNAPDWLPVFASVFGYGDLIENLLARVSVCDPLNTINFDGRVRAALMSRHPERR